MTPEQSAFQSFISSPVNKFLVTPDELAELERRAHVLVSECFLQGLTQQEVTDRVAQAFVRLINTHVKHNLMIAPDEQWLA